MNSSRLHCSLISAALAATFALASPALADMVNFKADLKGASVVPPSDSKGTGSLAVTYDTASKKLTWKGAYTGLTGAATAAHFHGPADAGKNAGVAVPIGPATSPLAGMATLTDAQAADLAAGKWYVNVHTAKFPNGEIRGQVIKGK